MDSPKWTDKAIVFLTIGIVFLAGMQWYEMHGSGQQTDKIIGAANLIEAHQKQMVDDNKRVLADNRDAIAKTLEQNRQALDASRQQSLANSQLEQRAWISTKIDVRGPMNFNGGAAYIPLTIEMTNTGHSPAQSVFPLERLVVSMGGLLPQTQIRTICGELKKPRQPADANGWTLFPGQTAVSTAQGAGVGRDEVEAGAQNQFFPGRVGFALVTCVDYTMTFDGRRHHQTIQTYSISFLPNSAAIVPIGQSPVSLYLQPDSSTD